VKPVPVIVTVVPPAGGAVVGSTRVTAGPYVKAVGFRRSRSSTAVCDGHVHRARSCRRDRVIEVRVFTVTLAAVVEPNLTSFAREVGAGDRHGGPSAARRADVRCQHSVTVGLSLIPTSIASGGVAPGTLAFCNDIRRVSRRFDFGGFYGDAYFACSVFVFEFCSLDGQAARRSLWLFSFVTSIAESHLLFVPYRPWVVFCIRDPLSVWGKNG